MWKFGSRLDHLFSFISDQVSIQYLVILLIHSSMTVETNCMKGRNGMKGRKGDIHWYYGYSLLHSQHPKIVKPFYSLRSDSNIHYRYVKKNYCHLIRTWRQVWLLGVTTWTRIRKTIKMWKWPYQMAVIAEIYIILNNYQIGSRYIKTVCETRTAEHLSKWDLLSSVWFWIPIFGKWTTAIINWLAVVETLHMHILSTVESIRVT